MGEVMKGCTLPGRMISSVGAVCFGDTTDTGPDSRAQQGGNRDYSNRDDNPDLARALPSSQIVQWGCGLAHWSSIFGLRQHKVAPHICTYVLISGLNARANLAES